jgi:hypothetical protein
MRKNIKMALALILVAIPFAYIHAGNPDRSGAAGSAHLLTNPWARSSGWGNANSSGVTGVEATFLNVAGLAFTPTTEVLFNHINLFQGSGFSVNSLGFSQAMGKSGGVFGLTLNSLSSGEIMRTTVNQPEGAGVYTYQTIDLGLSYSKKFSESIYGGMMVKLLSGGNSDVKTSGIAIDAGVQYRTSSSKENKKLKGNDIKFGVAIKNVGPDMSFRGDGLTFRGTADDKSYSQTFESRSDGFNLPTMVNIGAGYDFRLDKKADAYFNRLTLAMNYTSNSFSNDMVSIGLEYAYKDIIMLRGGYNYEKSIGNSVESVTVFNGYNMGMSVELPFTKNKSTFALDYSYRMTNTWAGIHSFGVRINLGKATE